MTVIGMSYRTAVQTGAVCLIPGGMDMPHGRCIGVEVEDADMRVVTEAHTGQTAYLVEPANGVLAVHWVYDNASVCRIPTSCTNRARRASPALRMRWSRRLARSPLA